MEFAIKFLAAAAIMVCLAGCDDPQPVQDQPDPDHVAATNFEAQVAAAFSSIASGDMAAALKAAEEAMALRPDSAEARMADGQAAYLAKKYERAEQDFTSVAKAVDLPAALRAQAYASRAVVEIVRNEFDAARLSLLRALRLDRRNPSVWYHLGVLSLNTFHFDEAALEQFELAARLSDPKDSRTVKLSRETIPALRASLAKAAASRPGASTRDSGAAAKLIAEGEALLAKKQSKAALKKFEAAWAKDPLSDKAALHYAKLLEANDKTRAGVDKALKAYRTVIDQNPAVQANYLAAAQLAYANARWITAVAIMDRAVAHDPSNRKTLNLLVASLQKAGKSRLADAWKAYRDEAK